MKNPLNIIIYGSNILSDINKIVHKCPSLKESSSYKNVKFFVEDKTKWNYFLISGEYTNKTFKGIKKILDNHYEKKIKVDFFEGKGPKMKADKNILLDVLIICVDNLEDKISKQIFDDIQKYTFKLAKMPFTIFLTKKQENPNIEQYWDLVTNKFYDIRNLYALKFPNTVEEKTSIYNKLNYFYNYYNSIGYTDPNKINSLNIMIVGQAGSGKSTLQNLLQREKIAREGEGDSITYKISFYNDQNFNITKIDTPGFENEETVKYVQEKIRNLRSQMIASKDHIDAIIYLLKNSTRVFLDLEKQLIKEIIGFNDIEFIFCSNTFGLEEDSDDYNKNKETVEDEVKKIITESNISEEKADKILDNIVYLNLVRKMKSSKEVEINIYGIDKLLASLYDILKNKKIDEIEIEEAKNLNDLITVSKKYPLLNMFTSKGDFKMKNRINMSKYILDCAKSDYWKNFLIVGLFSKSGRRKDMLKYVASKYGQNLSENEIDKKINEIDKAIEKTWKKETDEFFELMKSYKEIFESAGFDFSAYFYNEYTIAVGNYILKQYEENSPLFDQNARSVIIDLSRGINNGIEGINHLAEEWEEILTEIKNGKSDREWVRKFFRLKKKE